MPRKGENIYKRKDGRWEGRYIKNYGLDGKARYGYIYGKTYAAVKQALRDQQSAIVINKSLSSRGSALYEDILCSWLEAQRINVKESTYARYYQVLHTHIIPAIGKVMVDKISTQLIEQYIAQLIDSGRLDGTGGLAAKTVSDILTIIKASMEYARYNDYLVICNLDKICVKQSKDKMRVLSLIEQQKLTDELLDNTDLIKLGVLLSLYTGIRLGEICALKWENLNIADGILSVRETMQRIKDTSIHGVTKTKIVITEPKSKSSVRDIPLPPFITEIAEGFQSGRNTFVLTGERTRFIEPRTMQNRFKAIVKESDIEDANYHALRHTFATRCIEVGFDTKTLSEILGHANVNITLNRYVHSSLDLKVANMGKLYCISQS